MASTQGQVDPLGREPVVPSSSSLRHAGLHRLPRDCSLRQVSHRRPLVLPFSRTDPFGSFFNVERTQIRPVLALQIHYAQPGGITGHIMLFCMLLMYTTAHHRIRQQSFETFWYTHHLFIPFLLGMYTHAVGCFVRDSALGFSPFAGDIFWEHCIGYQGWRWEVFGGAAYLTERLYREIRARRETKITRVVRHPYGTSCPQGTGVFMVLTPATTQTSSSFSFRSRPSSTRPASGSFCNSQPCPGTSGTLSPSLLAHSTPTSRSTFAKSVTSPELLVTPLVLALPKPSCTRASTPWVCTKWHYKTDNRCLRFELTDRTALLPRMCLRTKSPS